MEGATPAMGGDNGLDGWAGSEWLIDDECVGDKLGRGWGNEEKVGKGE